MQNWNDVLENVKINLGVPINQLELSDEDLIGLLKRQVLPYFSQYSAAQKFTYISNANNRLPYNRAGSPMYAYNIPLVDPDDYIIDIYDAYPSGLYTVVDEMGAMLIGNPMAAIDVVMANTFIDAVRSLQVRNTWEFIPPRTLLFDKEVMSAVVVYYTSHKVLDTVAPDLYHIAFKPLCVAMTKLWIASMRSKFDGLATPFGQLNLNWSQLQSEGQAEKEKVDAILQTIPPDQLLYCSV